MTSFPDQPRAVVIQVPAVVPNGTIRTVEGMFQNLQGKRLTLESSEPLPVSTVVSVEYDDTLFLGEVVACAEVDRTWNMEVKVEQVLNGLQSLMALRTRLLSEGLPQQVGFTHAGTYN